MPSRRSASPSPPPNPPVPTVILPGPRATALKKIYTSALTSTLKSNSYANFSSCFPTPARYCPTALEGVWRQLNTRLEEECHKDFDKILEERDVISGLNQWDEILEQARQKKDRAVDGEDEPQKEMHLLSADELHTALLHNYVVKVVGETEGKLASTQKENREIMEGVKRQREEIERLVAGIEGVVRDIDGAVKALEDGGTDHDLRREIWEIETEVARTR